MDENNPNIHYEKIDHRLKCNQKARNLRRKQLMLRRLRVIFRLFLIIVLIYSGYFIMKSNKWYLPPTAFSSINNKSLQIQGNEITPTHKILQALRLAQVPEKPVYLLDTKDMVKHVKEKEPVKTVYVRRYWFPARLQVVVIERKPMLMIAPSETQPAVAFFTEDGKLIGREYLPLKKNFKTTLILHSGARGDDYRHWDFKKVQMVAKLAKTIENLSGEKLLYLDFRNPRDIYAKLESVYIRIGELDDKVFERIKWIGSIVPKLKATDTKIKYLDLRWEDSSYLKKVQ